MLLIVYEHNVIDAIIRNSVQDSVHIIKFTNNVTNSTCEFKPIINRLIFDTCVSELSWLTVTKLCKT